MTEEKKRQIITEIKLCMTVLKEISEEVSKERDEAFGVLLTTSRFDGSNEKWFEYCNISFLINRKSTPPYTVDEIEGAINELL
jgi:hypothetical protein